MSSIAVFSVEQSLGSLRLRLREGYAVVALVWLIAVYHRMALHGDLSLPFFPAIWMGLLPFADALSVRLRRIARARSLFGADYRYLHHYLLAKGWSRLTTLLFLIAIAALLATASYFAWYLAIPSDIVISAALVAAIAFHAWMRSVWRELAGFRVLITS